MGVSGKSDKRHAMLNYIHIYFWADIHTYYMSNFSQFKKSSQKERERERKGEEDMCVWVGEEKKRRKKRILGDHPRPPVSFLLVSLHSSLTHTKKKKKIPSSSVISPYSNLENTHTHSTLATAPNPTTYLTGEKLSPPIASPGRKHLPAPAKLNYYRPVRSFTPLVLPTHTHTPV